MRPPVNPHRSPIPWKEEAFYDEQALLKEIRRIFDICNSCRRCFNLCGVFPKLFALMDRPDIDGDAERLTEADIATIIPSCTLCDMCFVAKCPYVPPHPWNVDFPRLMLRYRAIQSRKASLKKWRDRQLAAMDRNGRLATACSPVSNAVTQCACTRVLMEKVTAIDRRAPLRKFRSAPWVKELRKSPPSLNPHGPAYGQKVLLYATCLMNYFASCTANSILHVFAHQGLEVIPFYPECCGMPLWEQGAVTQVGEKAQRITALLRQKMEAENISALVSLVPSCTLMLRSEWPDFCPENADVRFVQQHTYDVCEYLVALYQQKQLIPPQQGVPEGITLHMACHSRAQNQGKKAHQLLSLLPDTPVTVIERCSGHGGLWGFKTTHYDEAMQVGQPVFQKISATPSQFVASECPLALDHLAQGYHPSEEVTQRPLFVHPVDILALSYNLGVPC